MEIKTKNFEVYPISNTHHVVVVSNSRRFCKKLNKLLNFPYNSKTEFEDEDEPKFKVSNEILPQTLIKLGLPKAYVMARC